MPALERNNVQLFGQGDGVIVFAHGFGTDQSAWRFVQDAFAASHKVLLFDHVGFGESDRLAYDSERHGSLMGYALDVIDILVRLGGRRVVYVGHSIGGVIGLLASILRPELFARLVLLNASPHFIDEPDYHGGFSRRQVSDLLELMDRDYHAWADLLTPAVIGKGNDPCLARAFGKGLHSLDPMITPRFARLVFYVDCRASLAHVTTPTLILHNTDDDFAPIGVARFMHRQIAGSRLAEIQATGHCAHMTHPEQVISALQRHLAEA